MKDSTKKWTDKEFLKIRKEEVLPQWHTGKQIEDLDAQVEYQKKLPPLKHWATSHDDAVENNYFRFSCMTGVATEQQMLDNMLPLEDLKHDWMAHLDTYSRAHMFKEADEAIKRSTKEGRSVLNGYPMVNHNLETTRKITESVKGACVFNNSDTDQRLAAELAIAGGFSGVLAHTLHDLAQHTKTFPLEEKIYYAQYISRLCAYYNERGVPITCELPGDLSGWDMPAFRVAITVLDALLSARQGAKDIMLGMDIGMHLIQDIASCNMMYKMGRHYLDQLGYEDAKVRVQSFGWLGDFPRELSRATAIVAWNTITLIMANVRSQTVKSTDEGVAIATPAGNRTALLCAKQLATIMGNYQMPRTEELLEEEEIQELEVRALIDKTLELGKGDVGLGMIKAVDAGVLDTMFSPWRYLKGNVSFVRDHSGAIRYLDHGGLPLPKKVVDYHKRKIQEKEKIKGSKADLNWIIENIKLVSGDVSQV
jgi:methylaspartate mutase epsilon subunit